jgi:serine/threonine protein kinase
MSKKKSPSPKKINEGGYGCVYLPALPCNSQPLYGKQNFEMLKKKGSHVIGKVASKKTISDELSRYSKTGLNDLDEDNTFHIGRPSSCAVGDINRSLKGAHNYCKLAPEDAYQIIYTYGGPDLETYISTHNDKAETLIEMLNIIRGLSLMNSNNIFHLDIKTPNVVTGEDGRKFRLIDFGMAEKVDPLKPGRELKEHLAGLFDGEYFAWPADARFFIPGKQVTKSLVNKWNNQNYIEDVLDYYKHRNWNNETMLKELKEEESKRTKGELFAESLKKLDVYSVSIMILEIAELSKNKSLRSSIRKMFDYTNSLHYNPFKRCTMMTLKRVYNSLVKFLASKRKTSKRQTK